MKKRFAVIAMIIAFAAMLSIFTLPVYADEATDTTETTAAVTTTAPSDKEESPNAFVEFFTDPAQVIPLAVFVVILIVLAVVFFGVPKYREKTMKLIRSVKSECKKISWYSWKNTRKGTLVVIVCVLVLAIVILVLDTLFGLGLDKLTELFKK